jgi:hypothetical protein
LQNWTECGAIPSLQRGVAVSFNSPRLSRWRGAQRSFPDCDFVGVMGDSDFPA